MYSNYTKQTMVQQGPSIHTKLRFEGFSTTRRGNNKYERTNSTIQVKIGSARSSKVNDEVKDGGSDVSR